MFSLPRRGGCKIYDTRPTTCRSFHCAWLINPELGPEWRPTTVKMVLYYDHPIRPFRSSGAFKGKKPFGDVLKRNNVMAITAPAFD